MQQFSFETTSIRDLMIIHPFYMEDERGFFLKSFEKEIFWQNGIKTEIFEDFESYSIKGVLRGLHFQTEKPQAKLVRALTGTIYDVAVDLRKTSKTFGKWHAEILSVDNHKAFFIPKGFAHGFLVLSDNALVSYKCEGAFLKETDTGIVWNDPELKIDWPTNQVDEIIVSEKDRRLQTFSHFKEKGNFED